MTESTGKQTIRTKPGWSDVKVRLASFNRAELLALVQSLYAASRDNQVFLHARLDLGNDPIAPYKETISRWIPGQSGEAYKVLSQDRHHAVGYVCPSICTF